MSEKKKEESLVITCPDCDHVTSGPNHESVMATAQRHKAKTGHRAGKKE